MNYTALATDLIMVLNGQWFYGNIYLKIEIMIFFALFYKKTYRH